MSENLNQQSNSSSELKSFKPYLGEKAPILIQLMGGLIWLGAAGLLLQGVLSLLFMPAYGIFTLAIAVFAILTGKSLFGMKKRALYFSIIMALLFFGSAVWNLISSGFIGFTENRTDIIEILYAALLALVVYFYKDRFVN
jgi:hypothetical protein